MLMGQKAQSQNIPVTPKQPTPKPHLPSSTGILVLQDLGVKNPIQGVNGDAVKHWNSINCLLKKGCPLNTGVS